MLHLPGELSADDFLAGYWQKRPLVLPGALPGALPQLSPDELAWLATQDDVESRLVLTARGRGGTQYTVEQGPFDEARLAALPDSDWTLLVHDVEKHLPDFRAWLALVPFLPDWRIDDLMLSCAAPGGSVGPHRDHYDVFLCQMSGDREWRLADAASPVREAPGGELSLLEPWPDPQRWQLGAGDALYLPPGVPHWGIAAGLCMTVSIGMRAPARRELLCALQRETGATVPADLPDEFYADPDLRAAEALPGCIGRAAVERADALLGNVGGLPGQAHARALGSVVTDVKAWLEPEAADAAVIEDVLGSAAAVPIDVHGMARLAWHESGEGDWAFLNGHSHALAGGEAALMHALCAARHCDEPLQAALSRHPALLRFLLSGGAFAPADGTECAAGSAGGASLRKT